MMRRPAIALTLLALAATLLLAAPAPARVATASFSPPSLYEVKQAQLKVDETGSFSGGAVSWSGEGHRVEKVVDDPELPSLPAPLPSSGGGVAVVTERVTEGEEIETDEDGRKDPCGISWTEEEPGGFTVLVKPAGHGKLQTVWEIPHGIATDACGFGYDLFAGSALRVKSTVKGKIGAARLVLTSKGRELKSDPRGDGKVEQELDWDGKVVLERVTKKTR
jgi:hypothetical protein